MFSIFAFADVPECRPSDAPPYDDQPCCTIGPGAPGCHECGHVFDGPCCCINDDELTADDDAVISRSIHDEELTMAREATLFPAPASPWVRRAQMRDLPTFDRHNGAFAYEER